MLDVNGKVVFALSQKLINFIYWYVEDPVNISPDLWLLRWGAGGGLALEEVFDVLCMFAHEGLEVTHGLGEFDHGAWDVLAVFDRLSCVRQVLDFALDLLGIVGVCFIIHFSLSFLIYITFGN